MEFYTPTAHYRWTQLKALSYFNHSQNHDASDKYPRA